MGNKVGMDDRCVGNKVALNKGCGGNKVGLDVAMEYKYELGIIGAGNMATAIVNGILRAKRVAPENIIISDLSEERLSVMEGLGLGVTKDNGYVAENARSIILAVKPQVAMEVFGEIGSRMRASAVVSIMAGITMRAMESLGVNKICRTMPNTPCMIGMGMTAVAFRGYEEEEKAFVFGIFDALGQTVEVDESKLDAVTAVSGSGPAYVYAMIKALAEAGEREGLGKDESLTLAKNTFMGASELALNSPSSLDELITAVKSPGGTTEAALNAFGKELSETIAKGVEAATKRSKELSK